MTNAIDLLEDGKKIRKSKWGKDEYIYISDVNDTVWMNKMLYTGADLFKPIWEEYIEPKWEPDSGDWFISTTGTVFKTDSDTETKNFGIEHQTEKQAEWARDKMRSHNRLLVWLAEQGENEIPENEKRWYVYRTRDNNKYEVDWNNIIRDLCKPYMTKKTANKLCDMLNEERIEL